MRESSIDAARFTRPSRDCARARPPPFNRARREETRASSCILRGFGRADVRWSLEIGQVAKVGSTERKDGPDDGQAEAVFG